MIIVRQPSLLRSHTIHLQDNNSQVGFVPTMGALHEGHISLIREAKEKSDLVVCSIFVNPTQFNDPSDYNKYPNRLNHDIMMLAKAGTDILFLPTLQSIYPQGTSELEQYNLGYLETVLEGKYRPGHFQGVCQVMSRLLHAVKPQLLFMGQKDYQQCMVVQALIATEKIDVTLVTCHTTREQDGLAMSSRNLRLTPEHRQTATLIYKTLLQTKNHFAPGKLQQLKKDAADYLAQNGFSVDYFEIADADNLQILDSWDGIQPAIAVVAAFLGEVRLIDNMILSELQAPA